MCVPMQPLFVIRVVVTPALKLTLAPSAGTDVESERHDAHQHGDYGQDERDKLHDDATSGIMVTTGVSSLRESPAKVSRNAKRFHPPFPSPGRAR